MSNEGVAPPLSGDVAFTHNGKRVGVITKDGKRFITSRRDPDHYARRYGGYGIQRDVLKELVERGVSSINLIVTDSKGVGSLSVVPVAWWCRVGSVGVLNQRDGAQVFMSLVQLKRLNLAEVKARADAATVPEAYLSHKV